MKAVIALTFAILPMVAHASGFSVKDYSLGMKIEDYRFNYLCKQLPSQDWFCIDPAPGVTIGGQPIASTEIHFGQKGTAESIKLVFDPLSFDAVKDTFKSKYKSLKCIDGVVQNGMGARFKNTICTASMNKESAFVVKYDESLSAGSVFLITDDQAKKNIQEKSANKDDI